ncbi:MAG: alpha-L-glutamate ligase [Myxococcota bacterium]|nr:alpha-L-glutamate ligase [Myxococcota bacterium]
MTVHVIYENEDWMPPVRAALASRGLRVVEHFTAGGSLEIGGDVPDGIVLNRMSPSSHTRGHQGGVIYTRELLGWLESRGVPVVNGRRAFDLELSKVQQHASLEAAGIRTPKTVAVIGTADPKVAARKLDAPFITKHNQGGKGLGVQLFETHEAFDRFIDSGALEPSPDGVLLLQQYIRPREPFITRVEIVDGRFLYAIRSSTEGGFELCPADACSIDDAMCPVGDQAEAVTATGEKKFQRREDVHADDPLVQSYIRYMADNGLRVAGIEFVEDADGVRWTYDVNGTTNYNGSVEAEHGLHGMGAIADLCVELLQRRDEAAAAR